MSITLKNKKIIISAGGSGIGWSSAKIFLDKLRKADNLDLKEALIKFCCPEPLSHSMISKN